MKANYEKYVKLRDAKGFSDAEVARLAGISQVTMTHWKQGRSRPKEDKLNKIASVLDCSPDFLLGDIRIEAEATLKKDDFLRVMAYYASILSTEDKKVLTDTAKALSKHISFKSKDINDFGYALGHKNPKVEGERFAGVHYVPVTKATKEDKPATVSGIHVDRLTNEQIAAILAKADQISAQNGKVGS